MLPKVIMVLVLAVVGCLGPGSWPDAVEAATAASSTPSSSTANTDPQESGSETKMLSLIDAAPELQFILRRYPSFYGDPNTVHGDLFTRSQLFGDVGGLRNKLVEHGIYLDVGVTQFFGGNATGGKSNGVLRFNGSADYWLTLDTGKAGLWPGGAIITHAETSWNASDGISQDVGSLLPASTDMIMPVPGDSLTALPDLYLAQGVPGNILLIAGKINLLALADLNPFANNERVQFAYTGLFVNPILGSFAPLSSLTTGAIWTPNKQHTLLAAAFQKDGDAKIAGFDKFNGNYSYAVQYQYSPTILGLPGTYLVIGAYTTKDLKNFAISEQDLIGQAIGLVPVSTKENNYTVVGNFSQYLFVKGPNDRKGLPPIGIGLFGRAGWAPKGRNVIDQFYSAGIGGFGMLIPGRDHDNWGVGWAGTHISSDLRGILGLGRLASFKHAFEAFYNVEVTPAVHMTINTQVVDSVVKSRDTAVATGARLQVNF